MRKKQNISRVIPKHEKVHGLVDLMAKQCIDQKKQSQCKELCHQKPTIMKKKIAEENRKSISLV